MSDDDDFDEWEPVTLMGVGSAQAISGGVEDEPDDGLDLRWRGLYVPDLTSMTGWAVHRVRARGTVTQARVRRAGFRMIRRKR